jgi:hypothetical protein
VVGSLKAKPETNETTRQAKRDGLYLITNLDTSNTGYHIS